MMVERQFEKLSHRSAPSQPRRRSVLSLAGVALLSALGRPSVTAAGKRSAKCKKRCEEQVVACTDAIRPFCQQFDPGGNGCPQRLMPCCDSLKTCDAATSTECFVRVFSELL